MDDNSHKDGKIVIKDNEILNNYMRDLEKDIELRHDNVLEKSFLVSGIRAKWLKILFYEKDNLKRILEKKEEIRAKNVKDISSLRMKSQDFFDSKDERMIRLNQLEKITRTNIDYLEQVQVILKDFSYNIRNVIDSIKMQNS